VRAKDSVSWLVAAVTQGKWLRTRKKSRWSWISAPIGCGARAPVTPVGMGPSETGGDKPPPEPLVCLLHRRDEGLGRVVVLEVVHEADAILVNVRPEAIGDLLELPGLPGIRLVPSRLLFRLFLFTLLSSLLIVLERLGKIDHATSGEREGHRDAD